MHNVKLVSRFLPHPCALLIDQTNRRPVHFRAPRNRMKTEGDRCGQMFLGEVSRLIHLLAPRIAGRSNAAGLTALL